VRIVLSSSARDWMKSKFGCGWTTKERSRDSYWDGIGGDSPGEAGQRADKQATETEDGMISQRGLEN
jgi:hypothetical protein